MGSLRSIKFSSFMRMVANSKNSSLQLRLVQLMSHSYFSQRLISSSSMDTRKFCVADISGRQYRKSGRPEKDSQLIDGVIRWLFQSLANLWTSSLIRSMLQNLRHSTWNTHFKLHNSSTAAIYSPVYAISKPSLCHKKIRTLPFYWRLYSLCLNLSSIPSGSKILSVCLTVSLATTRSWSTTSLCHIDR